MSIELHTWNTPNGRKISVALEEMGLPYAVQPINISKGSARPHLRGTDPPDEHREGRVTRRKARVCLIVPLLTSKEVGHIHSEAQTLPRLMAF